ncbi:hypothetical protein KFD70_01120 [Bacillus pfraonensis]|nr:hypothetical protein [Bacillus pseudomycoides]
MPIIVFILSLLFMLIYANETFLSLVVIYIILSLIVGIFIKFVFLK